jgi:MFS family permease
MADGRLEAVFRAVKLYWASGKIANMRNSERFSALGYKDFRYFWLGQVISFSGTWMQSTAQGWLVYSLTRSPYYLGVVAASSSLPILLFSLFGGAMADRFKKRNVLLLTQALSIIPALAVGLLTSFEVVAVWHVIVLAFFLGTVNAFDIPTRQSFLIELVERDNLLNAIALNSSAFNGARVIGPVIAGMAITYISLPACFYINALSFLAVIAALARIRTRGEQKMGRGGILGEISEGMRYIWGEPGVRRPMLLVCTFSLFAMPFVTLLPVFAVEILGVGAKGLGFLAASSGAGALVAALTLAVKGDVKRKQHIMGVASILFALALLAFANSRNYYLSMSVLAVAGFSMVGVLTMANSSIQLRAPDGLRGRVMSVYTFVFLGMAPIGNYIMGSVADIIGTVTAVKTASAICLAVSVIILTRTIGR